MSNAPHPMNWGEAGITIETADQLCTLGEELDNQTLRWAGYYLLQDNPGTFSALEVKKELQKQIELKRKKKARNETPKAPN